ncbi:hypothetical protein V7S78_12115, partial [Aquirufa regiilacus]
GSRTGRCGWNTSFLEKLFIIETYHLVMLDCFYFYHTPKGKAAYKKADLDKKLGLQKRACSSGG